MLNKITLYIGKILNRYFSFSAIGIYIVGLIALSVSWTSAKVIQRNYKLLQEVSVLEQKVDVAQIRVDNQKLTNEYYQTDAYLELAARKQFNRAAPDEKLMIVSRGVALSKVSDIKDQATSNLSAEKISKRSNWKNWIKFLTGNFVSSDTNN